MNCEHEDRNLQDPYTVCIRKDGITICICTLILRCGGVIESNVTAPRLILRTPDPFFTLQGAYIDERLQAITPNHPG